MDNEHDRTFDAIPGDTTGAMVLSMFSTQDDEWLMVGDMSSITSAAVHAFKNDGTNPQTLIAVTVGGRINRSTERREYKMMFSPGDIITLIDTTGQTLAWYLAARHRGVL